MGGGGRCPRARGAIDRLLTMKRRGHLFNQVTDFNHLCRSARLAAHGTFNRDSLSFMFDLERNVVELKRQLEGRQYLPGEYRTFCITDPKPRIISASPFRDRVVHHSLCGTLEPVIERYLIDDCYACRVGKGTVAAIERARWPQSSGHGYSSGASNDLPSWMSGITSRPPITGS